MKLTDLNPSFFDSGGPGVYHADGTPVPLRLGVGLIFDCPCSKCGHHIGIDFNNPLDGGPPLEPRRSRWQRTGDTLQTLTVSPSILRHGGCGWHGWIRDGEVISC
jgi:hypothetical protein